MRKVIGKESTNRMVRARHQCLDASLVHSSNFESTSMMPLILARDKETPVFTAQYGGNLDSKELDVTQREKIGNYLSWW